MLQSFAIECLAFAYGDFALRQPSFISCVLFVDGETVYDAATIALYRTERVKVVGKYLSEIS